MRVNDWRTWSLHSEFPLDKMREIYPHYEFRVVEYRAGEPDAYRQILRVVEYRHLPKEDRT